MSDSVSRRDFLKTGGAAVVAGAAAMRSGAAEAAQRGPGPLAVPPIDDIRIGFVGIGGQGGGHVRNLLLIPGCRITAVCDVHEARTMWASDQIAAAGFPPPAVYSRGERDFERLCETEDLDLVFNATPWEWHVPIMLSAMKNGKHTATEVPAAMTLDDCWAMVEAAERHRKHCVMMENCNYDRMEMMAFNMVRQGVFGEILHAEGGYNHDLRDIKFADRGEGLWRRAWSAKLDGNLYPTHGLGPIANCLDINRGDRFDYLVSLSSPSRGLQAWAADHFPPDAPQRRERYVLGDVNTSLIKTANGRTIVVQHCTNLPRPYSRTHIVQGTRGLFEGYPNRAYIEGRGEAHRWVDARDLLAEFEHPLWKEIAEQAQGAGHGGMDFIEDYRLVECLRAGQPLDLDVYDGAAWSAVSALSERSIRQRSRSVDCPDFTRGAWRTRPPLGIVGA